MATIRRSFNRRAAHKFASVGILASSVVIGRVALAANADVLETWTCYGTATIEMAGTVTPQGNPVTPVKTLSVVGYDFSNQADCQNIKNYTTSTMLNLTYDPQKSQEFTFNTTPPRQPPLSCKVGDWFNGQTTLVYTDGTKTTYGLDKTACCLCEKFGACNIPGPSPQCVVETPDACAASGGTYLGDGTSVCTVASVPALPPVPAAVLGTGVVVIGIRKLGRNRRTAPLRATGLGAPHASVSVRQLH
jgi:hypothetical protein